MSYSIAKFRNVFGIVEYLVFFMVKNFSDFSQKLLDYIPLKITIGDISIRRVNP